MLQTDGVQTPTRVAQQQPRAIEISSPSVLMTLACPTGIQTVVHQNTSVVLSTCVCGRALDQISLSVSAGLLPRGGTGGDAPSAADVSLHSRPRPLCSRRSSSARLASCAARSMS